MTKASRRCAWRCRSFSSPHRQDIPIDPANGAASIPLNVFPGLIRQPLSLPQYDPAGKADSFHFFSFLCPWTDVVNSAASLTMCLSGRKAKQTSFPPATGALKCTLQCFQKLLLRDRFDIPVEVIVNRVIHCLCPFNTNAAQQFLASHLRIFQIVPAPAGLHVHVRPQKQR